MVDPAYIMLRSTSVVMTTTGASPLIEESPVSRPTFVGAVPPHEVGVLLVGQGLDRRRVERLAPRRQGEVDGELADDGLAGPGGRRDEHAATGLHRLAGLHLEVSSGKSRVAAKAASCDFSYAARRALAANRSAGVDMLPSLRGSRRQHGHRAGDDLDGQRQRGEPLAVGVGDDARRLERDLPPAEDLDGRVGRRGRP